jgi:ATP synthase protein I
MALERKLRADRWDEQDEQDEEEGKPPFRKLTRAEAEALRAKEPPVSPWRVVGVQAVVGMAAALLAGLIVGRSEIGWSVLYGAAAVVVPAALMARGMTSRLGTLNPAAGALAFMVWEFVKIAVSVAMLMAAPKIVQPLSWPALLVGLVLCMKVYWLALLWRRR